MPQLLVVTDSTKSAGEVVYRERVSCLDLRSSYFADQLVERIGWAVSDAGDLERRAEQAARRRPHRGTVPQGQIPLRRETNSAPRGVTLPGS